MVLVNCSQLEIEGAVFSFCKYTALELLHCHGSMIIQNSTFQNNGNDDVNIMQRLNVYAAAVTIKTGTKPVDYCIRVCKFINNMVPNHKKVISHSGALAIVMEKIAHSNIIGIINCTFSKNQGMYGGAIYAHYENIRRNKIHSSNISIHIGECNFNENRACMWGGAVYAHFRGKKHHDNCTFNISSSVFRNNSADKGGGAVDVGYLTKHCQSNKIHLTDCQFISNDASFGGGLALFSNYIVKRCKYNVIIIANSTWENNTAFVGAAVDITPSDPSQNISGFLPVPTFINCTFIENKLKNKSNCGDSGNSEAKKVPHCRQTTFNSGVFIVTRFEVHFDSHIQFIRNRYTALYVSSGLVRLEDSATVEFENNTGYVGGAVALYSFSSIVLGKNSLLNFTHNYAFIHGGGIYHQTMDQHSFFRASIANCFIKADPPNSNTQRPRVVFSGNTAGAGKSVYSESFVQCFHYCATRGKHTFGCMAEFTFDDNDTEKNLFALASSGAKFKIRNNSSLEFSVIPGSTLQVPFGIRDDFNHNIEQLVHFQEAGSDGRSGNIRIKHPYSLTGEIVPLGTPHSRSNLTATVVGVRQFSLPLTVTLLDCPPGHYLKGRSCTCGSEGYGIVLKCAGYQAHIKSGFWVGYLPENSTDPENLFYAPCSYTMCKQSVHLLPKSSQGLDKHMCRHNRTGVLCGRCTENHSVYYNSREFTCGDNRYCKYGFLFYFLSEILPMVTFFLVVITFDISFTSGNMAGFIFFSQHLSPLEINLEATPNFQYFQTPYQLVYGLFNFEYFGIEKLSFCLSRDFQVLDIIAYKYVTTLIAFGLVLILIGVARYCSCRRLFRLRRRISSKISLVNGLSAFLVTCYAQCTKTSFYILKYTTPVGYNGKLEKHYSFYGALIYFSSSHFLYAGPALVSLIVITTLPPLVLLLHPLSLQLLSLCGLSEHWIVNKILHLTGINKLMPLIDCFQGCYKNRLRFFASLYFVYRVAILVCFLIIEDGTDFCLYSICILILILGIHSTARPYKKHVHNMVESLILLNLAMVNACSILDSHSTRKQETSYKYTTSRATVIIGSLQLVLIYLPLAVAAVILLHRLGKRLRYFSATPNEQMCETDFFQHNRQCIGTTYKTIN